MLERLVETFSKVDDFCKAFLPQRMRFTSVTEPPGLGSASLARLMLQVL
jgi:hypothetical protein